SRYTLSPPYPIIRAHSLSFVSHRHRHHPDLHPFPTRRSSDLSCNSRRQAAATRAVAADLHTCNQNMELALALDLPFETVEKIALELQDFPATQACHVQMIALRPTFVKMLLPLEVH